MADYTQNESYGPKDSLLTGDPEKLILGTDFDSEFAEIQTTIATKYDSGDIATQVQAEAGASNEVLMTPLRVAQYLAGGSGLLGNIADLVDPNADRILFWDDSAGSVDFLTVSTGLDITATTLTVDETTVDHDGLLNFVANEHIDHTSVIITAGEGLSYSSGGTDISASATIDVDFTELTEETTLDLTNDLLCFYDNSATAHRKIPMEDILGVAIGDGRWYRSIAQNLSAATEATIIFNTADQDNLEKGTFSTSTGVYTAGSGTVRLQVTAMVTITALDAGGTFELMVEAPGTTEVARAATRNDADSSAGEYTLVVSTVVTLLTTETVTIRAETSTAEATVAGLAGTQVSLVELG